MAFARHQRNSQRSTLVMVISTDGELLTSASSSVVGEMFPVGTGPLGGQLSIIFGIFNLWIIFSEICTSYVKVEKNIISSYFFLFLTFFVKIQLLKPQSLSMLQQTQRCFLNHQSLPVA